MPNVKNPLLESKANPADVASIDAIITASYDGISGPAGKKRDWDRERSLFFPGARLIPTAMKAGGEDVDPSTALPPSQSSGAASRTNLMPHILDVEGFIARAEAFFQNSGFYEKEVARRVEQFGQIAHAWSTYESRHSENDPKPFMRGINSFQLFHDGKRWWIVNIYWQHESPEHPVPEKYLPKPGPLS